MPDHSSHTRRKTVIIIIIIIQTQSEFANNQQNQIECSEYECMCTREMGGPKITRDEMRWDGESRRWSETEKKEKLRKWK